jgi:hypothetical protein
MTGNSWIDLQMSLAEIEAELPDMSGELPRIPTVGNAMSQRGLKGAIDDALNLNRMSGRSGALCRPWPRGRFPDASVHLADDDRRAGACAPLTPGGEEAGSRGNGFR